MYADLRRGRDQSPLLLQQQAACSSEVQRWWEIRFAKQDICINLDSSHLLNGRRNQWILSECYRNSWKTRALPHSLSLTHLILLNVATQRKNCLKNAHLYNDDALADQMCRLWQRLHRSFILDEGLVVQSRHRWKKSERSIYRDVAAAHWDVASYPV